MTIDSSDFFVAGGTMRAQSPSYVTRPADGDLLNHLLAGEFCYVLTARQMGKSSLMVRTAQHLQEQGVQTAIIDLTSIGTVAQEEWYLGLLSRLRSGLRLTEVDVQAWWQAHAQVSAPQRFTLFLRDVVLTILPTQIVIFIDEIDATLGLAFRDDFFAALRALYNARANEPIYNRLTFALFGVATPTDLIQDRERTPFNIGHRINLQEFTYADAEPLRTGLDAIYPDQGEPILQRIFFWTNGHPYLTQKLCAVITSQSTDVWDISAIDQAVEKNFLSDEGRKDTNLTFVQDRIAASPEPERRAILTLYRQVYQGKRIRDDDRSPVQNRLELYGLLRVEQQQLQVRNELYRRVFNIDWIKANMPVNTQRQRAILAVGAMLVLLVGVVAYILNQPNPTCDTYTKQFNETKASALRIDALASLFNANCRQEALTLFYALSPYEQEELFLDAKNVQANSLITTIKGVYVTLDTMAEPDRYDLKLMAAMLEAMKEVGVAANDPLVMQISAWQKGREEARSKSYQDAVDFYGVALALYPDHPVIHFDRAEAYINLTRYDSALKDLDDVIRVAQMTLPTPTSTATSMPSSTSTATSMPTPTSAQTSTPTQLVQHASGQITPNNSTIITVTVAISSSPTRVPTITPTTVSPATNNLSQASRFMTSEGMIQIVKKTIGNTPKLLDSFNNSSANNYTYLARIAARTLNIPPYLCTNTSEIPQIECEALVMFYKRTDGPNWLTRTNWLVTTTPCSSPWYGVTCANGHITRLQIDNNQLNGFIPTEIGNLTETITLSLSGNELHGALPETMKSLKKLKVLNLWLNHIGGDLPEWLGELSSLEQLSLYSNINVTGTIPQSLLNLKLSSLDLNNTHISGAIPSKLGEMQTLTDLRLNSPNLTGEIPTTLGNLKNLTFLLIKSDQRLTGSLSWVKNLKKLTWLGINGLDGLEAREAISDLVPLAGTLQILSLRNNRLKGTIPDELGKLANLHCLDLSVNQLTGTIPNSLTNLTFPKNTADECNDATGSINDLNLSDNMLTVPAAQLLHDFLDKKAQGWEQTQRILAPQTADSCTNAQIGQVWFSSKGEANYVCVPAGQFMMGSTATPVEMPEHIVDLDGFWIMQMEVTNAEYARCVAAKICTPPANSRWNDQTYAAHPVANVNWSQATQYAGWVGGRLPTEAEWEKAARGTDQRSYPWGDAAISDQLLNYNSGKGDTMPVGSYGAGASPYGVLDMAGNVEEWVADWYSDTYYASSPAKNPLGPDTGVRFRVTRGGSYLSRRDDVRTTVRGKTPFNGDGFDGVGFRVILSQ